MSSSHNLHFKSRDFYKGRCLTSLGFVERRQLYLKRLRFTDAYEYVLHLFESANTPFRIMYVSVTLSETVLDILKSENTPFVITYGCVNKKVWDFHESENTPFRIVYMSVTVSENIFDFYMSENNTFLSMFLWLKVNTF